MKSVLNILGIVAAIAILGGVAVLFYFFLTNRTIDQMLAENVPISSGWTEVVADPPLTEFRRAQELLISIPNYTHDRGEKLPSGQIRLPDGRIASLEVEGIDADGNTVPFRFRGHTLSERDYVVFTPAEELGNKQVTKIRVRSSESLSAEQVFWRNRNPK